jgi:hypothetical protein
MKDVSTYITKRPKFLTSAILSLKSSVGGKKEGNEREKTIHLFNFFPEKSAISLEKNVKLRLQGGY